MFAGEREKEILDKKKKKEAEKKKHVDQQKKQIRRRIGWFVSMTVHLMKASNQRANAFFILELLF